jgi:hypothetical protein
LGGITVAKGTNTKELAELLDHVQTIDPLGAIVVTSAGIAGLAGIKGPITTIVNAFAGTDSVAGQGLAGPTSPVGGAINVLEWWNYFLQPQTVGQPGLPASDTEKQALIVAIGNAAGNMVEAGIMYSLVKNPETLKTIFGMSEEAVKGGIGLAKLGGLVSSV